MDYNLAALKVLCSQLRDARPTTSTPRPCLSSASSSNALGFRVFWFRGSDQGRFILDDGSDVVELVVSNESNPLNWKKGLYVMVVGLYVPASPGVRAVIKVHKIVDLSASPDREAMWHLEVIEAYKLFYLPCLE